MTCKSKRILIWTVPAILAAHLAAQGPVSGPQIGLLVDDAGVRAVTGVAGAAMTGSPIALALDLRSLVVSPNQKYVVGTGADGRVALVKYPFERLPLGLDAVGTIFLSRNGSSMAVQSTDARRVEVWSGLPDAPALAWRSTLPGDAKISSLAVSDDGTVVAAVLSTGTHDSVWRITSQIQNALLTGDRISGVAFFANRTDAVVADAATRRLVLIKDMGGEAAQSVLATAPAEAGIPIGVATSDDGESVYAATAEPGGVMVFDSPATVPSFVPCACSPSGMSIIGGSTFLLTRASDPVIWAFQATRAGARVFFVARPPIPENSAAGQTSIQ